MKHFPLGPIVGPTPDNFTTPQKPPSGKYLMFRLGPEEFAIQVLRVREVMGAQEITAVPRTQPYMKGVVNLRGQAIPVVDLRLRFGLPELPYTARTCIVVAQVDSEAGNVQIGVIVDSVSEMVTLHDSDIQEALDCGNRCLFGRVKIKNKMKGLLDIDKLLSSEDLTGLRAAAK